jgi:pSer/pThr/pTyr-binding forkhead associated (FHA) protein
MIIDNGSTHGTFINDARLSVAKVLIDILIVRFLVNRAF